MLVEIELIDGARAGGAGLERLLRTVWPEAYRIAFGILRDRGLAEDSAQESCAMMASSLPRLKDSRAFRTWMYKIAASHAITAARRRSQTLMLDATTSASVHADRSDALDLYCALGKLPLEQRAAVLLHYYAGFNSREIAAVIGVPASTVRFHLMLARRTLRKALSPSDSQEAPASKKEVSHVR